ncbi:hypothetical protein [Paraferrimonas sp. SM1919]|uniref:hypothetical protein n=1 Tax=Paraferrimonas sp. SM1919 TaxID=2662263 RepID=UPI0013D1883F|nr:hypothetical protein [Paraferrimonas sp. SM1919]
MYLQIMPNQPCEPGSLALWPHVTKATVQHYFPKFDLRTAKSFEVILQSVIDLSCYYFQLPSERVKANTKFSYMEASCYRLIEKSGFNNTKYKGHFLGKYKGFEPVCERYDSGLMIEAMFAVLAPKLIGIAIVDEAQDASVFVESAMLPSPQNSDTPYKLAMKLYQLQQLYFKQLKAVAGLNGVGSLNGVCKLIKSAFSSGIGKLLRCFQSSAKGNAMYIKLEPNQVMYPETLFLWDHVTTDTVEDHYPAFDLRKAESFAEVQQSVINLVAYYFQLPHKLVTLDANLVDLERHCFAKDSGCSYDDVSYGRIFCSVDADGNTSGGMSDQGLMVYMMLEWCHQEMFGVSVTKDANEASLQIEEGEVGYFVDCETPGQIAELLWKLKQVYVKQQTS